MVLIKVIFGGERYELDVGRLEKVDDVKKMVAKKGGPDEKQQT
jgi:hypothetical protein